MARLNEPAAPLESLELLRKRFLRQNKEIIKVNADQAVKIRGLEAETSRLLSENITLREANIRLSHQINKGRHALALDNVGIVKEKLQRFASGLTDLLAELAEAQSTLPEPRPYHDTPKRRSPKGSPKSASQQWRGTGLSASDLADPDGRLPPIVEGKYYPRRTLDADELGAVMRPSPIRLTPNRPSPCRPSSDLSGSPELGPPPIVNFDIGDPVKQNSAPASPSPMKVRSSPVGILLQDEDTRPLPPTLETRKKRRTSSFAGDSSMPSLDSCRPDSEARAGSEESENSEKSTKAGEKRKFSMREDDENFQVVREFPGKKKTAKDSNNKLELPIRGNKPKKTYTDDVEKQRPAGPQLQGGDGRSQPVRRALGEKPVNTDPMVSPVKSRLQRQRDRKGDVGKADDAKPEGSVPDDQKRQAPIFLQTDNRKAESKRRPVVSQVECIEGAEVATPLSVVDILSPEAPSVPSTNKGLASHDTPPPSELGARPSRRARPAVSYAEPNLRDKMRRPTKDLVDAVGVDNKSSRLSSNFSATAVDQSADAPADLPDWSSRPREHASPLAEKKAQLEMDYDAAAESMIDQIVCGSRRLSRAREAADAKTSSQHKQAGHAADKNVFDVASSSPESGKTTQLRGSRRVSSVPDKLNRTSSRSSGSRKNGGRRRETLASGTDASPIEDGHDVGPSSSEADGSLRGDRVATRRRSMML